MILFPFILCKYFLNGGFNTNIEKKVILIVMLVKIHHDTIKNSLAQLRFVMKILKENWKMKVELCPQYLI